MYAVLVNVKLSDNPDPTILREQVVPRVKELPGFVTGYWTRGDGSDDRSSSLTQRRTRSPRPT